MNPYLSSASLKAMAKGQLLGKYGTAVGAYLLHFLCLYPITISVSLLINPISIKNVIISCMLASLVEVFAGFFIAGEVCIYLKIACNQPVFVVNLFTCFRENPKKVLCIQAVIAGISLISNLPTSIVGVFLDVTKPDASVFLAYAVLFVLGLVVTIVTGLFLSQVYFLMLDFPEYTPQQLLQLSIRLMRGNIGRLFYIQLSFIPLYLLGFLSCGIGLLWLLPYVQATKTNFYLDLIKKSSVSTSNMH